MVHIPLLPIQAHLEGLDAEGVLVGAFLRSQDEAAAKVRAIAPKLPHGWIYYLYLQSIEEVTEPLSVDARFGKDTR